MRTLRATSIAKKQRLSSVLDALSALGDVGEETVEYIHKRDVRIGFTPQRSSGARWFDWRTLRMGVFVNANYARGRGGVAHLAALVIHEVEHLRQGIGEALSVRGELQAWQAQRDALDRMNVATSDPRWREIRTLNPGSREDLHRARRLMKGLAGPGYHIELLPLVPIAEEVRRALRSVAHRMVKGRRPEAAGAEDPGT